MKTNTKPVLHPDLKRALRMKRYRMLRVHIRCLTEEFWLGLAVILALAAFTVIGIPVIARLFTHH